MEEDVFHLLAASSTQPRTLSVAGAWVLAGQLREAADRRHERAVARVGASRACPFDLHGSRSNCHGMTPAPAAARRKAASCSAIPMMARRWCSQSVWASRMDVARHPASVRSVGRVAMVLASAARRGYRHTVGERIRDAIATDAILCRDGSLRMSVALWAELGYAKNRTCRVPWMRRLGCIINQLACPRS
jgi:hypothetical protein